MKLNLDKTDLRDNILIIQNDDNSIRCIPREGATPEELELFKEFEAAYPDGKPQPEPPHVDPIPTTEEKLVATQKELEETQAKLIETRASVDNMNSDFLNFMDFALAKLPN